jgi:carbon-monoxide dehydrogenase medium subunit
MMEILEAASPETIEELIPLLQKCTARSRIIAGGTDFIQQMRTTGGQCELLINLDKLDALKQITENDGRITIGAAATFAEIGRHPLLKDKARCLTAAAAQIGSPQMRNRATIGGNIANASACADSIAPLLVLDASVTVLDSSGKTTEKEILDIVTGPNRTTLRYDEVITAVTLPIPTTGFRSGFKKIGAKMMVTVSKINIAVGFIIEDSATGPVLSHARVALGAVGKTPRRFPDAETVLDQVQYSPELEERFAKHLSREIEESIRDRASMPYKRSAVKGLARDVLRDCFEPVS